MAGPAEQFKAMKSFWDIPGMKAGVVTGDIAWNLLQYCKAKGFALPAFNCTGSSSVNSVLEAAAKIGMPAYIQFSEGGSAFFAGKALDNGKKQASILGAVAGAHYTRAVAPAYGIPVLVHSDHCAKKLLPWFDGMLEADEAHFKAHGEPLFSSHMLDLSEEPHEENVSICAEYFKKMAPMGLILEMEIGITGGVEDGVDDQLGAVALDHAAGPLLAEHVHQVRAHLQRGDGRPCRSHRLPHSLPRAAAGCERGGRLSGGAGRASWRQRGQAADPELELLHEIVHVDLPRLQQWFL